MSGENKQLRFNFECTIYSNLEAVIRRKTQKSKNSDKERVIVI